MKRKKLYYLLLIIFLVMFAYSIYKLNKYDKAINRKFEVKNNYHRLKGGFNYLDSVDKYRLFYNNNDIKGIIKIDSLDINELVLQGSDNSFYLNHLETKESNIYGSIMLDYRTDLDNSKINIIYGHMSSSDITPFKKLEKYMNYDFYYNNPYINIITDKNEYIYQIFSVVSIKKNNSRYLNTSFKSEQKYLDHINWLKSLSMYNSDIILSSTNQILILQTCSSQKKDEFLLVISRKVSD